MAFNENEKAVLVVNGQRFEDWTSVQVVHRAQEAFPTAQFECTEQVDAKTQPSEFFWSSLQIKPGDACEIYLAGKLAITGYVVIRQAAYDANSHGVQITVTGKTHDLTKASAVTKIGNFDNQSWEAIARSLIAPFGVGLEVIGTLDATPFGQMQIQPGELVWSVLERLARSRRIVLGATHHGNLLAIAEHLDLHEDRLVEGDNILVGNCTIDDRNIYSKYFATGQRAGNDQHWGSAVSELTAMVGGSAKRYMPLVEVAEHPETLQGLQKRAEFEKQIHEGAQVTATITVQGWLRANGDLWRIVQEPYVKSPMLLLDRPLAISEAMFKQDNYGTTTTLSLVLPGRVNGQGPNYGPNQG
jgi:prophage tail gpP-like protein